MGGLGGLNQGTNQSMQAMAKRFKPNGGGPSLSPTTTGEHNSNSRRSSYEQVSTPTNQVRRGSAPVTLENKLKRDATITESDKTNLGVFRLDIKLIYIIKSFNYEFETREIIYLSR